MINRDYCECLSTINHDQLQLINPLQGRGGANVNPNCQQVTRGYTFLPLPLSVPLFLEIGLRAPEVIYHIVHVN